MANKTIEQFVAIIGIKSELVMGMLLLYNIDIEESFGSDTAF